MKSKLIDISSGACKFIRDHIENDAGLFRTESFNVDTLEWSTQLCDPDDFGDFAPFMAWKDKISREKKNLNWLSGQHDKMNSMLKQDSGFFAPYAGKLPGRSSFNLSYIINNVDMTLGFEIMHALTGDKKYLESFFSVCNSLVKYAISRKGFIVNSLIPALNLYYPVRGYIRFKPVVSGVFGELICDAFEMTEDEKYLDAARKVLLAFTQTKSFRKYGIVPDNVFPFFFSESELSSLTKSNTSIIGGLLRLYQITEEETVKEDAEKALNGAMKLFKSNEGTFFKSFNLKTGKVQSRIIEKGDNQSFMDNLINAYVILKDKEYLKVAERCAEFWMKSQSEDGLFYERKKGQDKWFSSTIDTFADMSVIMCKLYELTGKKKYKDSIRKTFKGFPKFVAKNKGLYNAVDVRNGKVFDRKNELKFFGGALKGMITVHSVMNGDKLFKDRARTLLTRDR